MVLLKDTVRRAALAGLILSLAAPPGALAQFPPPAWGPPAEAPAAPTFRQEELDQLLAPIALYPDALLAQILMASTYPQEVLEAARWVRAYPNLQGPEQEDAMLHQPWDPSVKSLTAFPRVLVMMADHLEWTQRLGDAFLAQQPDVMASIQRLRAGARAAGYLQSTAQHTVIVEPRIIRIEPVTPGFVYVPVYDPFVVYGPWWYPAYPPYYAVPLGYGVETRVFYFTPAVPVRAALWAGFDWHRHRAHIVHVHRFRTLTGTRVADRTWRHDPAHRRGIPYQDPGVHRRFAWRAQTQQAPAARETSPGGPRTPARQPARDDVQGRPGGGPNPRGSRPREGRPDGQLLPAVSPQPAPQRPGAGAGPQASEAPRGRFGRQPWALEAPRPGPPSQPPAPPSPPRLQALHGGGPPPPPRPPGGSASPPARPAQPAPGPRKPSHEAQRPLAQPSALRGPGIGGEGWRPSERGSRHRGDTGPAGGPAGSGPGPAARGRGGGDGGERKGKAPRQEKAPGHRPG